MLGSATAVAVSWLAGCGAPNDGRRSPPTDIPRPRFLRGGARTHARGRFRRKENGRAGSSPRPLFVNFFFVELAAVSGRKRRLSLPSGAGEVFPWKRSAGAAFRRRPGVFQPAAWFSPAGSDVKVGDQSTLTLHHSIESRGGASSPTTFLLGSPTSRERNENYDVISDQSKHEEFHSTSERR